MIPLLLLASWNQTGAGEPATGGGPVAVPPKELGLDPFYTKYVSAYGLPVVGSGKVSDYALSEAAYLVDQMLSHRPEIRDALIKDKIRVAVMAYSERTTDIPEHRNMKHQTAFNRGFEQR